MKKYSFLVLLVMVIFLLSFWTGCTSTKDSMKGDETYAEDQAQTRDDYDEIERLLGINRDENKSQEEAKQAGGERGKGDDLIKLLEVDEGKKKTTEEESAAPAEDKRITRLQKQIEDLRKQLKKKNLEIADLKAQLLSKETKMAAETNMGSQFYGAIGAPRKSSAGSGKATESYVARYQQALSIFREHRYREALSMFEELLATDTGNDYSDNAQYWIGECLYAMGRYREAIMAFEKVFTFRFSNKNDYAQFKIGQCYYKLGDRARARQEFQQLIDNYPDSELVARAREYLTQM